MTIANLLVRLTAEAGEFHREMESAARRAEQTGRRIARAGIEISKAFAPVAALAAGGLAAAVQQSALVHGRLAQAWDRLTLQARALLREVGGALTPAFLKLAEAKGGLIERARQLVAWFEQLSPGVQGLIVKVGLFLTLLGPTTLAIGAAIRAFGALWSVLTMLAGLIGTVLGPVLAFLVSPIGLVIVAVGLLVAGVALLIRHWQQVKQWGLEAWIALKLGVINAVDGMLGALEKFAIAAHLPGFVDSITDARDALSVMRLHTLKEAEAIDALGKTIVKLPLLPDWLRHPLQHLPSFALPTVPGLPALPSLQAADTLAKLKTALDAAQASSQAFGSSFDLAAAQAAAYKSAIDELIGKGVALDAVLNGNGLTLRTLGTQFQDLSAQVHLSLGPQIASALQGFAEMIGEVVSGATKSLKTFGGSLLKVIGDVMVSLGAALIALGTAKLAALSLNPFAAIALGGALVIFGKALSNAAQAIANPAGGGGGGGGGGGASSSSMDTGAATEGSGRIILELRGDGVIGAIFSDPRNQDGLAQALKDLSGRNVEVVPVAG